MEVKMDLTKNVKITYNLKMEKNDFDDLTNVIKKLNILMPSWSGLKEKFTENELIFMTKFLMKSDEIYREEFNVRHNI
jgi:hypothetical protein